MTAWWKFLAAVIFILGIFVGIGLTLWWQQNTQYVPVPTNTDLGQLETK